MEVHIFHQAIQLIQLQDISVSMLKRILGLHSKKKKEKRKKRGKSEKREGEKRTSVILGEKGPPP
jgi:predicted transcriptional regulator